jgi:hypothetical protein
VVGDTLAFLMRVVDSARCLSKERRKGGLTTDLEFLFSPYRDTNGCFSKEEILMRNMTMLASVVGLLAALAATPIQAEIVVSDSVDISLQVFVPCANGEAGELVDLNGPLHILITFNINVQ